MAKQITFFYDCLSPFSFFAFHTLKRYAPIWKVDLQLRPALLGGVMAATNNSPPMMRPWAGAAAKVSVQDLQRNLSYFNTPDMRPMPSNFFGPEGPADKTGLSRDFRYMRFLTAVSMKAPEHLVSATEKVFGMIWVDERTDDKVVITENRLKAICVSCGISESSADDIVASITTNEVKKQLKSNVEEAVELGAYGMPFTVIGEQVYFGSDRFEQMAQANGLPWHGPDPSRPTTTAKL